jgi:hypothetical protein
MYNLSTYVLCSRLFDYGLLVRFENSFLTFLLVEMQTKAVLGNNCDI